MVNKQNLYILASKQVLMDKPEESRSLDDFLEQDIFRGIAFDLTNKDLSQVALKTGTAVEAGRCPVSSVLTIGSTVYLAYFLRTIGVKQLKFSELSNEKLKGDLFPILNKKDGFYHLNCIANHIAIFDPPESDRFLLDLLDPLKQIEVKHSLMRKLLQQKATGLLPKKVEGKYLTYRNRNATLHLDPNESHKLLGALQDGDPERGLELICDIMTDLVETPSISGIINFSFCTKMNLGGILDLFLKWVNPCRVQTVDHEISVASALRRRGIKVPVYYGFLSDSNNAFLVTEALYGVDFRSIGYSKDISMYVSPNYVSSSDSENSLGRWVELLKANKTGGIVELPYIKERTLDAYYALGQSVRDAFYRGVNFNGDLALRNAMLVFRDGEYQVYFVDFEKTKVTQTPISEEDQENARLSLTTHMRSDFERDAFNEGYKSIAKTSETKTAN